MLVAGSYGLPYALDDCAELREVSLALQPSDMQISSILALLPASLESLSVTILDNDYLVRPLCLHAW